MSAKGAAVLFGLGRSGVVAIAQYIDLATPLRSE
jgi:hypothetical protein